MRDPSLVSALGELAAHKPIFALYCVISVLALVLGSLLLIASRQAREQGTPIVTLASVAILSLLFGVASLVHSVLLLIDAARSRIEAVQRDVDRDIAADDAHAHDLLEHELHKHPPPSR